MTPTISVILPVINAQETLPSCLESLFSQAFKDLEIIAIDDKSIDASYTILKQYKKFDKRIKIYRNIKKYGLATTLNRCLRKAKGQYIVFMDPKDTITKNKIQKQFDYLVSHPKAVGVGTQCIYLNSNKKRIGKSSFPPFHSEISQKPLHGVTMLFEGIMIDKFRLPKDLLYFPPNKSLYLYSDMAVKLIQYGQLANLPEYLQLHQTAQLTTAKNQLIQLGRLIRFWVNSRFEHEVNLSFQSFFSTAVKSLS